MKTEMKFEWAWCDQCQGAAIICPKCGHNCCSGWYGEVDGKECDVCPAAYDYQNAAYDSGDTPTKDEIIKRGGRVFKSLSAFLERTNKETPMWLCMLAAINEPEMVKEFDRLRGTNLSQVGSPLDLMVDEQTGRLEGDFNKFVEFVRDCIYERVNQPKERG